MESKPKVIVIGLDGATWDLIKPWVNEGKLPNFKKINENGASGILKSTIPPLSPSAWTSIFTGCTPVKHRIFGFMKRKNGSYFYRPISSRDRKRAAIWELLSKEGKKSIIINALFSYPLSEINGIIISGLGTPSKNSNFVYPLETKDYILENFPDYDVDFNEDLLLVSNNLENLSEKIKKISKAQAELTIHFIQNHEADFVFSIFRALDVIQHYFWDNKEIIFDYYVFFDKILGDILEKMKGNTCLLIVSDHGFAKVEKYFCVNNWLMENNFLSIKNKGRFNLITAETVKKILLIVGLKNLVWNLKHSELLEKFLKFIPSEDLNYINLIDWTKTKAYFYEGSDGIIFINLKKREPVGTVDETEYTDLVQRIRNGLEKVKDPDTGDYIIDHIYTKKTLFGTNDFELPDIYLLLKDGYRAIGHNRIDDTIFMPPVQGRLSRSGDHSLNGIFLAYGTDIKASDHNYFQLWDVAPTLLHILKVPLNYDMDGKVLKEIFLESSLCYMKEVDYTRNKVEKRMERKIKSLKEMKKI